MWTVGCIDNNGYTAPNKKKITNPTCLGLDRLEVIVIVETVSAWNISNP